MRRSLLITFLCLAALAGGAALLFSPTTGKESKPKDEARVIAVKRGAIQAKVVETGTLEPARTIEIKSQFSGEVQQLLVHEGQEVGVGQPLAVIQQEPNQARQVAQKRAELEQERVNLENARIELDRMKSLLEKGFVSQKDLDAAEKTYRLAKVREELARRELLLSLGGNQELYTRYLERELSSAGLEKFVVKSPTSGTVLEVMVSSGELITSGTGTFGGGSVLMTIADLSRMIVQANINEVNIGRIRVGQEAEVRLDALPDRVFYGQVAAIAPKGDKKDSIVTYQVIIEIENKDQMLRPLMTANVDILTDVLENVIALPLEALRTKDGDDIVFVMTDSGRLERKVRVGLRTESKAVIVHGLAEGETVVIPTVTERRG